MNSRWVLMLLIILSVGVCLLGGVSCHSGPDRIQLPNTWSIYEFICYNLTGYRASGYILGVYENYTTSNVFVRGTIDWGDGIIETFEDPGNPLIPYNPTSNPNPTWGKWPSSDVRHTYPGLGTYVVEIKLTAYFSSGSLTSTFKKEIVISK